MPQMINTINTKKKGRSGIEHISVISQKKELTLGANEYINTTNNSKTKRNFILPKTECFLRYCWVNCSCPQCLHTFASSFISSLQLGHIFIVRSFLVYELILLPKSIKIKEFIIAESRYSRIKNQQIVY